METTISDLICRFVSEVSTVRGCGATGQKNSRLMIGTCSKQKGFTAACRKPLSFSGAVKRNRTADLLITNQLLYHLSYNGK